MKLWRTTKSPQLVEAIKTHNYVGTKGLMGKNGTGKTAYVPVPLEWRTTTPQVCGLYPFSAAGTLPLVGGPIGNLLDPTGTTLCFDHINWFLANLIGNPSLLLLAKPGLGKSTLAKKTNSNLAAENYVPLTPGDSKGEYSAMMDALGGEIRKVSRFGGAALNPCDPGDMAAAARLIGGDAGARLLAEAIGKATVCICTLLELGRNERVKDYEQTVINIALTILYDQPGPEPVLSDLIALLGERPRRIEDKLFTRRPAQARFVPTGDDEADARRSAELAELAELDAEMRYFDLVDPLRRSLSSLTDGQYGDALSRRVVRDPNPRRGFSLDTSAIKSGDGTFLAAVLICAWSDTYGRIEADQALADAGLMERVLYCLTLDELWRVLQRGGTMEERVVELTRLNRTDGIGQMMISHSLADTTRGMAERAGAIIIGGTPHQEVERLQTLVTLNDEEAKALTGWWSESTDALTANRIPPGAGKFLLKVSSDAPGYAFKVKLTAPERDTRIQDTNQAWAGVQR